MSTPNKIPRKTIKSAGVGKARQKRYAATIDRYKESLKAGYYVEALALMESLICDRMESILNELDQTTKHSFQTTGRLAGVLKKKNLSTEWNKIISDIYNWLKVRNHAVHELAKITGDLSITFEKDYAGLKKMAEEGYELFKLLNNYIRKYRRANNNQSQQKNKKS